MILNLIQNLPRQTSRLDGFTGEFHQIYKEQKPIPPQFFQKSD